MNFWQKRMLKSNVSTEQSFLYSIGFSKQNVTTFQHFNPEFFPSPTLILSALQNPSSLKNASKNYFLWKNFAKKRFLKFCKSSFSFFFMKPHHRSTDWFFIKCFKSLNRWVYEQNVVQFFSPSKLLRSFY